VDGHQWLATKTLWWTATKRHAVQICIRELRQRTGQFAEIAVTRGRAGYAKTLSRFRFGARWLISMQITPVRGLPLAISKMKWKTVKNERAFCRSHQPD
jgi:hypothetical protein